MLNTTKNAFVFDYCEVNPCVNGGSCENEFDNFKCSCSEKFTGERCETSVSKCLEMRCFNGGVCDDDTGLCRCLSGFSGANCEIEPTVKNTNPCSSNPCEKGVCAYVKTGYKCYCLPNYTGNREIFIL